jgi:hypothetical protein
MRSISPSGTSFLQRPQQQNLGKKQDGVDIATGASWNSVEGDFIGLTDSLGARTAKPLGPEATTYNVLESRLMTGVPSAPHRMLMLDRAVFDWTGIVGSACVSLGRKWTPMQVAFGLMGATLLASNAHLG